MSSRQTEEFSHKAGEIVGQTQMKKEEYVDRRSDDNSSQSPGVLKQTGERVKSMAQGATESVKNKLGINSEDDNNNMNKNPTDLKNPNNTTTPSMPGLPPSSV